MEEIRNRTNNEKIIMIIWKTGNLFDSTCDALVNPVNTQGVSGSGLAKEFKSRFPKHVACYEQMQKRRDKMKAGEVMHVYLQDKPNIIFAATKDHWKNPSQFSWIEKNLDAIKRILQDAPTHFNPLARITSVAIPKLGCGLGGLNWEQQIKPLMIKYLSDIIQTIEIYE